MIYLKRHKQRRSWVAKKKDSLLHTIKRLYTELFLVTLHNRIDSYHALRHSEKDGDISRRLYDEIDKIAAQSSHTHTAHEITPVQTDIASPAPPQSIDLSMKSQPASMLSMTLNGLSVFFHSKKVQENDPHMAGKLQQCVWDHVHSAHRFARTGDSNTAKLHANIATNAIKTLSHYMPESEYKAFYDEISHELFTIKHEKPSDTRVH
jgi:hypothetical protein